MVRLGKLGLIASFLLIVYGSPLVRQADDEECRCYPGDACWPSVEAWDTLNSTTSGRLVKVVPIGEPCHDPNLDEDACQTLQVAATVPGLYDNTPAGIMNPLFTNETCSYFTPSDTPCAQGNWAIYAIAVEDAADVVAGVKFAVDHNIRLTIKNTGHDYMGKSAGAGSLALWMHGLKSVQLVDYSSPHYIGKAGKVGAGIQGYELNKAVADDGFVFMAGACASVGSAGGYTQGGGHSPLSNLYGLSADNVLEWEVVDGTGRLLTASPEDNPDLYWALSGGGGGTYGVVVSMTEVAHEDTIIAGGSLNFTTTDAEAYWAAIEYYHSYLQTVVDAGVFIIGGVGNGRFTGYIHGPKMLSEEVTALFEPMFEKLIALGVNYTYTMEDFDNYGDEYTGTRDVFHFGVGGGQAGGYLISSDFVNESNAALTQVAREIAEGGLEFKGFAINVTKRDGAPDNAVLPAWRDTLIHAQITLGWNASSTHAQMTAQADALTNKWLPILKRAAPDGHAYMNEGDSQEPDWQWAYYGENYKTLRAIKRKYDPEDIFYANKAVGSDEWVALPLPDGRLCRLN